MLRLESRIVRRVAKRVCFFVCVPFLLEAGWLIAAETESQTDWPDGNVLHARSTSPDGQFGIVVPGSEDAGNDDRDNFLANLKTHEILGKIKDADYFERQNHRDLTVVWAPGSSGCVLTYQGRFGFDVILLLELNGSQFTQTDLGKHIDKALTAAAGEDVSSSAWFRFGPGKMLLVRALTYTGNPKMMDENTKQARFAGTFDRGSKRWTAGEAHRTKDWDALSSAYSAQRGEDIFVVPNGDQSKVPKDFEGVLVNSEEEKEEALDQEMNTVYQAVRLVLAPGRFAKVKQDQIAWLKKRDATPTGQRSGMIIERIKALEVFLW
jgi:uncharacterized protein YecT (DUF1311 family)